MLSMVLVTSFTALSAQSSLQDFSISGGFGFQQYCGDLGNGLYRFNSTEYGVACLSVDYSLNRWFSLKFLGTLGDLGFCQTKETREAIKAEHEAHGGEHVHGINPKEENLNSRMAAGVFAVQFEFANGYILPEWSRFAPYVYAGAGLNRITDRMEMNCVAPGLYSTLNVGTGFKYQIVQHLFLGYQLNFGQFTSDKLDKFDTGKNDLHMQNAVMVGYAF